MIAKTALEAEVDGVPRGIRKDGGVRACIVTGDRYATFDTWSGVIAAQLRAFQGDDTQLLQVIHGGANGIDYLAGNIASQSQGMQQFALLAQWKTLGKAAGPSRNRAMLSVLLIAQEHGYHIATLGFHDDLAGSKGTKDMLRASVTAGVPTYITTSDGRRVRFAEPGAIEA